MLKTHAVGIDLGTTYSCISYLNEHGEPVTLANQEGELSTPSVVLFDDHEVIVGTEALRNAVVKPNRVIQNSKRYIGDRGKRWKIDGKRYTPVDVPTLVLRKLLDTAEEQIGEIEQAVITVPAQFSEVQRQDVVEAGLRAGLKRVDMINEPVAAALCYVLGTEGLWFTELADEQRIMVYDLGGGTFDLSLVKYHKNEVSVVASSGDLHLGGIDWNRNLLDAIAKQFVKEFDADPRKDPESLQFLALEVENTKRSLTVRPKAALTCQHSGHRKSYQVEQSQFEQLTGKLVTRTCDITQQMLKDHKMGWAHVDVILTVGGASRMPMIRNALKKLGGRTLNTSLSPDQSIAHGATYYAGMLLTNTEFARSILNEEASARLKSIKQQSVNARGLGILVRDEQNNRVPHYLIPANTPLPTSVTQTFGTVIPSQSRVHLRIIESGTVADQQYVELGTCVIDDLTPNLPEDSQIEVTISYDEQARVHVSAKDITGGKQATTEIIREENLIRKDVAQSGAAAEETGWKADGLSSPEQKQQKKKSTGKKAKQPVKAAGSSKAKTPKKAPAKSRPAPKQSAEIILDDSLIEVLPDATDDSELDGAAQPIPLCNECGEPLDHRGECAACAKAKRARQAAARAKAKAKPVKQKPNPVDRARRSKPRKKPQSTPALPTEDEILELEFGEGGGSRSGQAKPATAPASKTKKKPKAAGPSVKAPPLPKSLQEQNAGKPKSGDSSDEGEDEFWQMVE